MAFKIFRMDNKKIHHVKKYKYKRNEYSYLENALEPFNDWCMQFVPTTIAPNMITFLGFLLNVI